MGGETASHHPKPHNLKEKEMNRITAALPLTAALLLLALLLACSSDAGTATPESITAPTLFPTEAPTAAPTLPPTEPPTRLPATPAAGPAAEPLTKEPTPETSEAAETPGKTCRTPSGKCPDDGPENRQDEALGGIQEMLGDLPQDELACLEENFPTGEVWQGPNMPMPNDLEATRALFNCLSDQSIARMMIVPSLQEEGAVSPETAECVAQGPTGGIIRAIVTGQETQEEPEATMGTMLAAMMGMTVVMLDCLSDEEWAERGMEPQDREILRCINRQIPMEEMVDAVLRQDMEKLEQLETLTDACAMESQPTSLPENREGAPATPTVPDER